MRWLLRGNRPRVLMAALLVLAFMPNALFLQHYGIFEAAPQREVAVDEHAAHGAHATASTDSSSTSSAPPVHCHVGPESCAASSGLSIAIVIAAALALTLMGGRAFLLDSRSGHLSLFDITRRLAVPPRMNLLST